MYTYLLLNLFSILGPMTRAFEPKIKFYKEWPFLFVGMLASGTLFIFWDEIFTQQGIWGFNPDYLVGIYFGQLPLEECLFFVAIPYASIFIYATFNYFVKWEPKKSHARLFSFAFGLGLLVMAYLFRDKAYTHVTFLLTGIFLWCQALWWRGAYLGRFLVSYGIVLVPFMLVNGVLTGSWVESPIVWYNNQENLGIRVGTIPIEDSVYGLLMLLVAVTVYEELRHKVKGAYSYERHWPDEQAKKRVIA